jgi:transcription antitermination factor NusG
MPAISPEASANAAGDCEEHVDTQQTLQYAGTNHPARGWWALYTRHQHEKTVAELLSLKGVESFLPLYSSLRRWKDRKVSLQLPLFPGYLFVPANPDSRLSVVTTPGIHMIIPEGDRLAIVSDQEIQSLRRAVEGPFGIEPHPFLRCGDRVRVTRGSLCGVEGILVRRRNSFRLVLSVEMLAQAASVEVDASDVEPVKPSASGRILPMPADASAVAVPREPYRRRSF